MIETGSDAPDFDLKVDSSTRVRLSDFRGRRNVLLVFHPFAFTAVCEEEALDLQENLPQVEIELDPAAAQRYGLKPGDVRRQSSTLLASEEVADLFYDGQAYDVHVWTIPSARDSLTIWTGPVSGRHAAR